MKIGVAIKIDVTKINKARLFKGEKGTYLDLTTFIDTDEKDQYDNNGFVTQSPTKEEREAKEKLPILGNVRVFYSDSGKPHQNPAENMPERMDPSEYGGGDMSDDIPFNRLRHEYLY